MTADVVQVATADYTTIEVARLLGLSVRSIQMMVDRGELDAWKTPGGHRRISLASVERWQREGSGKSATSRERQSLRGRNSPALNASVLLIDDSVHFQNLVTLLIEQHFPGTQLHVADDGIAGLALCGKIRPGVLLVDLLLPGIDGSVLIRSLRLHPQFSRSRLVVLTSLEKTQLAPYTYALQQTPVVHKKDLVSDLPKLLATWLPQARNGDISGPAD